MRDLVKEGRNPGLVDDCSEAVTLCGEMADEIEKLRKALEPFAKSAEVVMGSMSDETGLWVPSWNGDTTGQILVGDVRRAHDVLEGK